MWDSLGILSVVTFLFHLGFPIFPSNAIPCPPTFFFFHLYLSRREMGSDGRNTIIKDIYGSDHDQVWIKSTPSQILCLCLTLHKGPRAVGSSTVYLQTTLSPQHLRVQDTQPISAKIRGQKLPAQMVQACRFPLCWHEWESSASVTRVVPASLLSPVPQLCLL